VYNQIYNTTVPGNGGTTALNYTSPILHTAVLTSLAPNTKYYYQVGDGTTFSSTFNFTSLADPSKSPASQYRELRHMENRLPATQLTSFLAVGNCGRNGISLPV